MALASSVRTWHRTLSIVVGLQLLAWTTSGYLHINFDLQSMQELSAMFIFLGIGFVALCLVFALMYAYAASLKEQLLLSDFELHETRTSEYMWAGAMLTGLLCVMLAIFLPDQYVPYSGYAFVLLGIWFPFFRAKRARNMPEKERKSSL